MARSERPESEFLPAGAATAQPNAIRAPATAAGGAAAAAAAATGAPASLTRRMAAHLCDLGLVLLLNIILLGGAGLDRPYEGATESGGNAGFAILTQLFVLRPAKPPHTLPLAPLKPEEGGSLTG